MCDPLGAGSVAVFIAPSLKLKPQERALKAWQGWRLPLSIEESKTNGGEDRMAVNALRQRPANPRSSRAQQPHTRTPPAVVEQAKATPKAP